jgi:DNA replication protein DnaC
VLNWRSVTYDLLKELGVSVNEFVDLILEWGYLFIDDIKLETKLHTEVFTALLATLYNHDSHPGVIFTENWDPAQGEIKAVWNTMVPEFVFDRLVNMTVFMPVTSGSRRFEQ